MAKLDNEITQGILDSAKHALSAEDFGKEDATAEDLQAAIERMKSEADAHDAQSEVSDAVAEAGALSSEEKKIVIDIEMLNELLNRTIRESEFVAKDLAEHNDARASWLNYAHQMVIDFIADLINRLETRENNEDHPTIPAESLTAFGPILANMLAWRPGTAVLGNEDEWEPAKGGYDRMIGQEFWFTEHKAPGTGFTVTSVEKNVRMPTLLRFNHDNRYAHRTDAVAYLDALTRQTIPSYVLQATSIRFIEFPYLYQPPITIYVDRSDGSVVKIVGSNGPEFDGRPAPKCVIEAIEKDRELHPDLYPDLETEEEEDGEEREELDPDGGYLGLTEEELLSMLGEQSESGESGEEEPMTPEEKAEMERELNGNDDD